MPEALTVSIGEALPDFGAAIDYRAGDPNRVPVEPKAEPVPEPKVEPKVEAPKVEPKTEPKVEPQVETKTEPPKEPESKASIFDTPKTEAKTEVPKELSKEALEEDFKTNNVKTEEGKESWKTLKEAKYNLTGEVKKLQSEIESLKAKTSGEATEQQQKTMEALRSEIVELKKQLDASHEELTMASVERSPRYKADVLEPKQKLIQSLKELAESKDLKLRDLMDPIEDGDNAKFREVISGLDSVDQFEALKLRERYLGIKEKDETYRNTSSEKLKALIEREQKEQEESRQQETQVFRQSSRNAFLQAAKTFNFLREHPDNPNAAEWNQNWRSALANIEMVDPTTIPAQDAGQMQSAFLLQPFLIQSLQHFTSESEALKAELEKRDKVIADLSGGTPSANSSPLDGTKEPPKKVTPEDADFGASINWRPT